MIVNVGEEKALEFGVAFGGSVAESGEALGGPADIFDARRAVCADAMLGGLNQVSGQEIEDAFQSFVEFQLVAPGGMLGINAKESFAKRRYLFAKNGKVEQIGFAGVVEIGGIVSDFVYPIDELGFERRAKIEQVFRELRKFQGRIIARMLDDAFANLESKIEAGIIEIAMFELLDDAQGVEIVIEATPVGAHHLVEFALAGMAERGVADVVDQRESFSQLGIRAECGGDRASNLRDFECVGEAIAKVIRVARGKDLRFRFQAPKRSRMHDTITVAREFAAVRMRSFGKAAASR